MNRGANTLSPPSEARTRAVPGLITSSRELLGHAKPDLALKTPAAFTRATFMWDRVRAAVPSMIEKPAEMDRFCHSLGFTVALIKIGKFPKCGLFERLQR